MPQESLLQQILDNLTTAVLLLDSSLQLSYLNPAAEMLLEASGQRVAGQPVSSLFLDAAELMTSLRTSISDGQPFTKREARLTLGNGQALVTDYTVTPMPALEYPWILLELLPRDRLLRITREEAQVSQQEANRVLVRGLAHEIKNPLGGIRGAAQLLARELDTPALHDYTDVIIHEADRLGKLVDRMLGPSQPPRLLPINIHQVTEHVCSLLAAESLGELLIQRDYDPSIPQLLADREQLIQAVLNMVRNAMQAVAAPTGNRRGQITLRTRTLRQFTIGARRHRLVCQLDICDNGPGIPPQLLDSIFYPMVSGRADGTGLGLSITQTIISRHQGLLECDSVPGRTCFSLFLPLTGEQG